MKTYVVIYKKNGDDDYNKYNNYTNCMAITNSYYEALGRVTDDYLATKDGASCRGLNITNDIFVSSEESCVRTYLEFDEIDDDRNIHKVGHEWCIYCYEEFNELKEGK